MILYHILTQTSLAPGNKVHWSWRGYKPIWCLSLSPSNDNEDKDKNGRLILLTQVQCWCVWSDKCQFCEWRRFSNQWFWLCESCSVHVTSVLTVYYIFHLLSCCIARTMLQGRRSCIWHQTLHTSVRDNLSS